MLVHSSRLDLGVRVREVSVLTELGLGFGNESPLTCCARWVVPEPRSTTRSADTIDNKQDLLAVNRVGVQITYSSKQWHMHMINLPLETEKQIG